MLFLSLLLRDQTLREYIVCVNKGLIMNYWIQYICRQEILAKLKNSKKKYNVRQIIFEKCLDNVQGARNKISIVSYCSGNQFIISLSQKMVFLYMCWQEDYGQQSSIWTCTIYVYVKMIPIEFVKN